ncbi:MAG: GrpB family protein [Methanospirillum sp.]|nr:GrpB family protein [Methanospirillum sp.]
MVVLGLKRDMVRLFPHDPCWEIEFTLIKEELLGIMGQDILDVHHIGSTAIRTIPAKPILDIAVVIGDFEVLDSYLCPLKERGYYHRQDHDKPDRRLFIRGTGDSRTHHLHFFRFDSPSLADHLFFRDYLRSHPESASEYARLKQDLAEKFPSDRERYTTGKESFIRKILAQNLR